MRYAIGLVILLYCVIAGSAAANAEKRVALVIGNASYKAVAPLPNPKKDARDVAAALRAAAFTEVVEHYDLGMREMLRVLAQFEDKATSADWAMVYYAGHGIEVDGRNYLVPIDAELKRATDVEDETVALDRVLARIARAGKLQLVILDSCRFNPFKQRMLGTGTRAISERGLGRVEPAQPNVIVAYAARDGQVALDGKAGDNSPYARALVKYLDEPGLELQRFFRKVREDVMAETGGQQRPYEYGSLVGPDLFLKPGVGLDPNPAAVVHQEAVKKAKAEEAEARRQAAEAARKRAEAEAEASRVRKEAQAAIALAEQLRRQAIEAKEKAEQEQRAIEEEKTRKLLEQENEKFSFVVCNNSIYKAYIAVQHYSKPSSEWLVEGWWHADSGKCTNIGRFQKGWFEYFGTTAKSARHWAGSENHGLCVDPNANMKRINTSSYKCRSDEIWVKFIRANVTDATFTWNLGN